MLRTALADRLRGRELAPGYLEPDYDAYSFHRVPGTVASLLGVDVAPVLPDDAVADVPREPSTVVLLFVDAYGWTQFVRTHDSLPFFEPIGRTTTVTPLTTVYPSETAACVTTVHTGRPPVEHGLLGWDAYDPDTDVVYTPLPYRARDGGDLAIDRSALFDGDQLYAQLRDAGVDTHAVAPAEHRTSGVRVDATVHGYRSVGDFAATLRRTIDDADDPGYVYAYYPGVDSAAHHRGPASATHDAQLAALGGALERELGRVDDPESVVCCLVADHGQVATPPRGNRVLPDTVVDALARDRAGTPVVTGGPRNVHLHLGDDADEAVVRGALDDAFLVYTREEALDVSLWGPGEPGPAFDRNCGDLVAIPQRGSHWWDADAPVLGFEGMHGGLHEDELLVPFAAFQLADLA